jgi:hypothetical protein
MLDAWIIALKKNGDLASSTINHILHVTRTILAQAVAEHAIRWISRTADQDCLGLLLPGTAAVDGYTAEKAKGNVKSLAGGATMRMEMEAGFLNAAAAAEMEKKIGRVLGSAGG